MSDSSHFLSHTAKADYRRGFRKRYQPPSISIFGGRQPQPEKQLTNTLVSSKDKHNHWEDKITKHKESARRIGQKS